MKIKTKGISSIDLGLLVAPKRITQEENQFCMSARDRSQTWGLGFWQVRVRESWLANLGFLGFRLVVGVGECEVVVDHKRWSIVGGAAPYWWSQWLIGLGFSGFG